MTNEEKDGKFLHEEWWKSKYVYGWGVDNEQFSKMKDVEGPIPKWVLDILRKEVMKGGVVSREFANKLEVDLERDRTEVKLPKEFAEKLRKEVERSRIHHDGVITRRKCEKELWDDKEEDQNMTRIMKGVEYE